MQNPTPAKSHESPQATTMVPGTHDVLLGRGRAQSGRPANRYFRFLVAQKLPQYNATRQRSVKMKITTEIVDAITQRGRFLKYDKEQMCWIVLGKDKAREVVSQTLRNHRQQSNIPNLPATGSTEEGESSHSRNTGAQQSESKASDTIELFTDEELRSVLLTYEDDGSIKKDI